MTLTQYISDFLRDAQYRIATLSVEMDKLSDDGSYRYKECLKQRLQLIIFMSMLYEGKWFIQSGFNHIQIGATADTWTEQEIIQEIQELRYYTNMNEVPYVTFTAHYPQIASYLGTAGQVGSGESVSFPSGQAGYSLFYTSATEVVADSIDPRGGALFYETIEQYFQGRP